MTLAGRLRELGVTAEVLRDVPPRHALLRDDAAAIAVRHLRDGASLTPSEAELLFGGPPPFDGLRLDIVEGKYLFSTPEDVLGPSQTTAILYRAARQLTGGSLLDLGCGCGTLALLLHRSRTVATDLNPKAVALARFNAESNEIAGLEFRTGNLYEPIRGERFDLVVSQPPYIPLGPGDEANPYYHAGARGDELARAVLADAARHLNHGGSALVFSDWPLASCEQLRDRIPHEDMRATVWRSRALAPSSYYAPQSNEIAGVYQCLVRIEEGEGYREVEVLPHEWASIDIQSLR